MVLLVKIQESSIVENLRKRYMDDYIFVSFGRKKTKSQKSINSTTGVESHCEANPSSFALNFGLFGHIEFRVLALLMFLKLILPRLRFCVCWNW